MPKDAPPNGGASAKLHILCSQCLFQGESIVGLF